MALGTPVLVIAGLGHAGETVRKAIWKRISKHTLRDDVNAGESVVEVDLEAQVVKVQDATETEEHRQERMDKNVERESSRS